jgi:hypothetical protein
MLQPLTIALAMVAWLSSPGWAQEIDPARAAAVKAGMVFNFVKYTRWSDDAFDGDESKVIITIVGESDIEEVLPAVIGRQTTQDRQIEVRQIQHPSATAPEPATAAELTAFYETLRDSHLVYFGRSEGSRLTDALEALAGGDVLTVSDVPEFAANGGMLGLTIREGRVAFDANLEAIESASFQISSQVLRLARIVSSGAAEGNDSE